MTRRAWVAFAAASLIWGVPYLFIKIAVDHGVTPPVLAWGRVTLGALVLLTLAGSAGTLGSVRKHWRWLLAFAVAEIAIPFPMLAIGEERVPSSLAAIMVATVPLIGALLAIRFDHSERPTPVRALGLALGFGGVIALVGIDVAGHGGELLGIGAIMITATGYAIGPMLIKHRLSGLDPRATMGASLAIASLILLPWAALDLPRKTPSAGGIGAVVVLGLLCTAAGFVVYAILIGEAGTSRATVITYVNPVVAVALGVALLGEHPGAGAVAGLLLILAGGWLATDGRLPPGIARMVTRRTEQVATRQTRVAESRVSRAISRLNRRSPRERGRVARKSPMRMMGLALLGVRGAVPPGVRARRAWSRPPGRDAGRNPAPRTPPQAAPKPRQLILIRMIVFTTNAIANPTVHRFRLRSTSDPPPNGPAPVPTPNAPDSPASLPECIRIRNTSTTHRKTWTTPRTLLIGRRW